MAKNKYDMAIDINTPPSKLEKLSGDENWEVREGVAQNTSTSVELLEKLSGDKDWNVREAAKESYSKINKAYLYMDQLKKEEIGLVFKY